MSEHLASFAVLGAQALVPITIGSFQSLRVPAPVRARRRAARRSKNKLGLDDDDDDDILDEEEGETLTMTDSLLFPVMGSVALLGLWALIKYVDKKWLDIALGVYFSIASVFAVQSTVDGVLHFLLRALGLQGPTYHLRISSGIKQIFHMRTRRATFVAFPLALALPVLYVVLGRPYLVSNALALCLATAALALLRLDGFPTAMALLSLLLAYDVFWVFYTPVMVTVAKGIDAPIKLMAPKEGGSYSMLGLGDVVIPGLLIALCLRFDLARHAIAHPKRDVGPRSSFSKPYFVTAIVSYILGLVATIAAMVYSGTAQPALLYLSPTCILGPLATAAALGEVGLMWKWRDEKEEEGRDETIEAASEVAMLARKEAKAKEAAARAVQDVEVQDKQTEEEEKEKEVTEDDSWMNGSGVAGASANGDGVRTRSSKRKGGKRK